jgi:hypothetical protein
MALLTMLNCANGLAIGSLGQPMSSAQVIFFGIYANLFIICKYLIFFTYILLSNIYTNCRNLWSSEKLRKCYRMRVHIISEGGNAPITCLCPHVVYTKCYWIKI